MVRVRVRPHLPIVKELLPLTIIKLVKAPLALGYHVAIELEGARDLADAHVAREGGGTAHSSRNHLRGEHTLRVKSRVRVG